MQSAPCVANTCEGCGQTRSTQTLLQRAFERRLRSEPRSLGSRALRGLRAAHVLKVNRKYGCGFRASRVEPDIVVRAGERPWLRADLYVEFDSKLHRDERARDLAKTEILLGASPSCLVARVRDRSIGSMRAWVDDDADATEDDEDPDVYGRCLELLVDVDAVRRDPRDMDDVVEDVVRWARSRWGASGDVLERAASEDSFLPRAPAKLTKTCDADGRTTSASRRS